MVYQNRSCSLGVAIVIAWGLASGAAQSADPPVRGPMTFEAFDLNADGALTKEEFEEARAKRIAKRSRQGYPMRNLPNAPTFEDIDTNNDSLVAPDEFGAHQMQHRRQMMQP